MTGRNIYPHGTVRLNKALVLMASWQNRIKDEMRVKKITQEKLAERIGVTQSALSHWFSGRRKIDLETLLEIADALGLAHSEILSEDVGSNTKYPDGSNVEPSNWLPYKYGRVPLVSWVNAGDFCEAEAIDLTHMDVEEWLPMPPGAGPRTYALRVEGMSMCNPNGARSYPPGVIIFVDPDKDIENGKRVIARIGNDCTFKELTEDAGQLYLMPLNSQFNMIRVTEDVRFCGVVVGTYIKE